MKANRHITSILTVLFIGFSTLNGQASARTQNTAKQERPSITKAKANQVQQKNSAARQSPARQPQANVRQTSARQTPARQPQANVRQTSARQSPARQTQANVRQTTARQTPARQAQAYKGQTREVKPNNNPSSSRYGQTASLPDRTQKRPVSMSTTHNPKSDYRAPHTNRPMKENKYSNKRYYGGHHYHNAYPAHRVKTHYHYDTHVHHYNVLYYPSYHEIYWTRDMYRNYHKWYPNYRWNYNFGYRIQTISIFDAKYNMGELANVYGRVYSTWYNRETDDYLLFFGGDFGRQQFTLVLPGRIARKFSRKPTRYFLGQHLTVTGLITTFDGIPEIVVKNRTQVMIY